jgi:hypothetical protein
MIEALPMILTMALGGRIPRGAIELLIEIIPSAIALIKNLRAVDIENADKRKVVVESLGLFIDEELDSIPAWSSLTETRRDRILGGLVELCLWIIELEELHGESRGDGLISRALERIKARR